jgi:AraC-like DNA-binding protein
LTGHFPAFDTHRIAGFEELIEAIEGTRTEIVQVERGKLQEELFHALIAGLRVDVAKFNVGVRSKGESNKHRILMGILTGSANRVTRSSYESHPGDVLITPPGSEYENRYYGGASILVTSVLAADIESVIGPDSRFGNPTAWGRNHFKGNADTVRRSIPRLQSLLRRISEGGFSLPPEAAEFWKRAVIEAMTTSILEREASERDGPVPSALKVVRQVEEYLDTRSEGPIHISQICNQLHLSRRTLHRAFHEALGIGPISFLRYQRLCAVHTALRSRPAV